MSTNKLILVLWPAITYNIAGTCLLCCYFGNQPETVLFISVLHRRPFLVCLVIVYI